MLRALKDLFDSLLSSSPAATAADEEHQLHLATAVLLVEVMRADPDLKDAERAAVIAALRRKFNLAEDELARLLELAETRSRTANDFFAFTSTLNDRFSHPQKVRMVEFLWQVAYADGAILLRAVAGGTELDFRHDRFFDQAARANHSRGWNGAFDKLDAWMASASPENP